MSHANTPKGLYWAPAMGRKHVEVSRSVDAPSRSTAPYYAQPRHRAQYPLSPAPTLGTQPIATVGTRSYVAPFEHTGFGAGAL